MAMHWARALAKAMVTESMMTTETVTEWVTELLKLEDPTAS